LKKSTAACVVLFTLGAIGAAGAAEPQLKPRPKPPPAPTWWVSGGALLWTVKSASLPPTLTTFVPGSPSATAGFGGALGVPGTVVLSPDHLNYGPFGGGRFTLGHWLESDPRFGLEADGFFLGNNSSGFSQTSDGSVPLRGPFSNVPPGAGFPLGSSSFVLADPGFAAGGQVIRSSLQFWGIEGNGLYRAYSRPGLSVSVIAGLRYLDLREGLSIASTENLLPLGSASFTGTDNFSTRNQFFGAQLGVKAEQQFGQFDGSVVAKVALGDNYQTVSINGDSVVSGTGFGITPGTTPGGIFTQATNIGQQTRNQFAVVPEAQLQLGYTISSGIRLFVGYDVIYLSNVVRPGDQIDTTLNFTGNPTLSPGSTLTGAARPEPLFKSSSFWAQGVKFGASYQF
jgi:Putative beta barrel porin-7 (BBP7)